VVDRLTRALLAVSIRGKILGMGAGLVLFFGIGTILLVRAELSSVLSADLRTHGISLAGDLAARSTDLILTDNRFAIHQLILDTLKTDPDVRYVFVQGVRKNIIAHSFALRVPSGLAAANDVDGQQPYAIRLLNSEEGLLTDVAVPILDGRIGRIRVGLSNKRLDASRAQAMATLGAASGVALLLSLGVALLLTNVLMRPVTELVFVTRAVGRGDLSARAMRHADDEIGELTEAFNVMVESLTRSTADLLQRKARLGQLLSQIISAQEDERKRIARELHDEAGQLLSALSLGLGAIAQIQDLPPAAGRLVADAKELLKRLLDEVHRLAVDLRPQALDQLGLTGAIESCVQEFGERTGLRTDLEISGLGGVSPSSLVEITIYRVVQEALANVRKHAHASRVGVLLQCVNGTVVSTVEDDGVGFDAHATPNLVADGHLGLFGMQERAALLNGRLTIESARGRGTTVVVEIPLSHVQDSHSPR